MQIPPKMMMALSTAIMVDTDAANPPVTNNDTVRVAIISFIDIDWGRIGSENSDASSSSSESSSDADKLSLGINGSLRAGEEGYLLGRRIPHGWKCGSFSSVDYFYDMVPGDGGACSSMGGICN